MMTEPALETVPLDSLHRELGARMVPFAGYDMPVNYPTGIIQEHLHVRHAAGLFDVSHMGAIFVPGDASVELEKLLPADLKELQIGHIKYSLLLNEQGGVEDDLLVSRFDDGFLLIVNAGRKHHDLNYFRQHLPTVTFESQFDKAMFALQGPKARDIMTTVCPDAGHMMFMTIQRTTLFGHDITLSCSGYTGEDGFEILCDADHALEIAQKLLDHPDVNPIGLGARDSLRLEAGLCLYGHELDQTISPVEAGLTWALGKRRKAEGGFAGALRILTEIKDKPHRRRIAFIPESRSIPREGCTLHDATGAHVGIVTSGGQSPTLSHPIAMGYISKEAPDHGLSVNIRGTLYPITLIKLPFVATTYKK